MIFFLFRQSYDFHARDVAIGIQGPTCLVTDFLGEILGQPLLHLGTKLPLN